MVVTLPIVCLILALTLYPFAFTAAWPDRPLMALVNGQSHPGDLLQNIALFVPLGVSLCWLWAGSGTGRRGQRIGSIFVAGLIALGIELGQLAIPGRTAALFDVLANAAGAGLGCWGLAGPLASAVDRISGWGLTVVQHVPARVAALGLTLWLATAGWLVAHWQRASLPVNWSERYTLQIGAASDGRRFWPGYVGFVALYDRAFTESDARVAVNPHAVMALQPLFAYDLTQYPLVISGPLARPLVAQGRPLVTAEGMGVGYQRWLMSREPLAVVSSAIADAGALTMVAQVAPRDPERLVEGLMVNYGREIDSHNISLIQSGPDLLVRMRLPLTRPADDRPVLRFANVFADEQPQVLAFSYDGTTARLFVDGHRHPQWYAFGPGEAFINRWLPIQTHQIGGWSIALAIIFSLPVALAGASWRGSRWWFMLPVLSAPFIIGYAPQLVALQPLSETMALASALTMLVGGIVIYWLTKPYLPGD
ncbi:VanZ family protein [Chloroflexus sp.]|uniref:VanZ family protein n=2 Tax=Chloroflexus TaxID=1107 RepID=UPI002FDB1CD1